MSPEVKFFSVSPEFYGLMENFLKSGHSSFFSVIKKECIISMEQIDLAFSRSERIMASSRVNHREALFMMLMTGETQISRAISAAGVDSSTREIAVVYESDHDLSEFMKNSRNSVSPMGNPLNTGGRSDAEIFHRMIRVQIHLMN